MDERAFDALLEEEATRLPPDLAQSREINPWHTAMSRVIWGIGLTTLTLNFSNLNYILPTLGGVLSFLGYRALRRENGYFKLCWLISIYFAAATFCNLVLNATVIEIPPQGLLAWRGVALTVVQMFCLRQGIRAVRRKAGQPDEAGAVTALMVWYAVLVGMGVLELSGWLFGLPLLAAYVCILRSLGKIPALLDTAGYEIHAAPVRLPDRVVKYGYALALVLSIVLAGYCFCRYPMQWEAIDPEEHAGLEEIKAELTALGLPEQVADDLTAEDLMLLDAATYVQCDTHESPFNEGRQVTTTNGNHTTIRTVYDVKELLLSNVAVRLADGRWMVIHHFLWQADPGLRTTECMLFWPADRHEQGYHMVREFTGRLLYDLDGTRFAGDYYSLGYETYTSRSFLNMDGGQERWPIATFSLPREGDACRGYVAYVVEVVNEGWIFDAWNNYTHQTSPFVYPMMTAEEHERSGIWNGFGGFQTAQTAVQFFPHRLKDAKG